MGLLSTSAGKVMKEKTQKEPKMENTEQPGRKGSDLTRGAVTRGFAAAGSSFLVALQTAPAIAARAVHTENLAFKEITT